MDFLPHEIHVRSATTEDPSVSIFFFTTELHRMNREPEQPMRTTLTRFVSTWTKKVLKKKATKGKASKAAGTTHASSEDGKEDRIVVVEFEGSPVNIDTLTNRDWQTGMSLKISVDGAGSMTSFRIVVDPPALISLQTYPCKSAVTVGLPITPIVTSEYCDSLSFSWHIESAKGSGDFRECGSGATFTPAQYHVDCRLKIYATPSDTSRGGLTGRPAVYFVPCAIAPRLPEPAALSCRIEFNSASRGALTRVVCWNILAEPFATSDYAKKVLFGYCKPRYLESEYRLQLVLAELQSYAGDIICLQEVDSRAFTQYLEPALAERGYQGFYTNKSSSVREGCAFFASSRIRVHGSYPVPIGNLLAARTDLGPMFRAKPWAREILTRKLGTIAQLALCERVPDSDCEGGGNGRLFIMANTHLFYHPRAAYARLLQTDMIARAAMRLASAVTKHTRTSDASLEGFTFDASEIDLSEEATTSASAADIPLILCGDLNSTPETAVIEYLERGFVDPFHEVWASVGSFKWGRRGGDDDQEVEEEDEAEEDEKEDDAGKGKGEGEEEPKGLCKKHWTEGMDDATLALPPPPHTPVAGSRAPPLLINPWRRLSSSAGYPTFTNYVAGFKDLLDYIFVPASESAIRVRRVGPFPEESVLCKDTALPSAVFPSDHLSVVVDVEFL